MSVPDRLSGLGILLAAVVALSACTNSSGGEPGSGENSNVQVEKEAPRVETKKFSAAQAKFRSGGGKKDPLATDVEGYTEWFYSCKATFETEDVHSDDTSGAASVALKIKAVRFDLALPITLHLPANPPADLKEHEDGHVQICSMIYGLAGKVASQAGKQVLGRTFEGMGKDMTEARAMALGQAQRIVARVYQEGTNDLAEQVSRKYDQLCHLYSDEPQMSRASLAQSAFNELADPAVTVIK
ncbi:MAG: hypothetical protein JST01_09500 [Cyanobacteria bacterium SZAS TMP-1]|nr:hypothetical protein [Cyanobacteria bacterium SZAS TMP-1]